MERRWLLVTMTLACVLVPKVFAAEPVDSWIGRKVLLKASCIPKIKTRPVDRSTIPAPCTVSRISGNWLWIGQAWVKKRDVVPIEQVTIPQSLYQTE